MIHRSKRRVLGLGLSAATALIFGEALLTSRKAVAFADEGAFHPRLLDLGQAPQELEAARRAAGQWSLELMRRTSAPGRLAVELVPPTSDKLLEEPTLVWQGRSDVEPLSNAAIGNLKRYLRMGGVLIVDDRAPLRSQFTEAVKRELRRVLPEHQPTVLPVSHVLYKTFYLLPGPAGRVQGPPQLEVITAKKAIRVLFLRHDLLGALQRSPDGRGWAQPTEPGGAVQREQAIRLSVNIAMYVLCSDYKDDQVHAPFLMRRRQRER